MSVQMSQHGRDVEKAGREASLAFWRVCVTFCLLCGLLAGGCDEFMFQRTRGFHALIKGGGCCRRLDRGEGRACADMWCDR